MGISFATPGPAARAMVRTAAVVMLALAGASTAWAVNVPVLYVAVNGGPAVSFANDQACDGTKAVLCIGTGSTGDLLISSFELSADPDPYVAGSFNFYNASTTSSLAVEATILFPMTGSFSSPALGLGTGIFNNVFGGGALNITVEGLVDLGAPLLAISEISPGVPFSVCDNLGAAPSCQNALASLATSGAYPGTLNVLSSIGLRIRFDLSPDTTATIGLDPQSAFGGGTYFSLTPQTVVPLPGAIWMLVSGLGALAGLRRRLVFRSPRP